MEAKALTVVTPRTFRSGETPHLKITTRNLEKLTFTAYKLNPEAYFRKKHGARGRRVARHRPGRPRRRVDGRRPRLRQVQAGRDDLRAEEARAARRLRREGHRREDLQATTLVLGSDLDAIVKTSRDQVLVFAQDMKTGKGRPGARVLVSDARRSSSRPRPAPTASCSTTGTPPREANRRARRTWSSTAPTSPARAWACPSKVAQGLTPRAYLYTDRPAYRPGQEVALRGVVREVKDGQYANVPRADLSLRGRPTAGAGRSSPGR